MNFWVSRKEGEFSVHLVYKLYNILLEFCNYELVFNAKKDANKLKQS